MTKCWSSPFSSRKKKEYMQDSGYLVMHLLYEMCSYHLPLRKFFWGTPSQIPDFFLFHSLTSHLHASPKCCNRQKCLFLVISLHNVRSPISLISPQWEKIKSRSLKRRNKAEAVLQTELWFDYILFPFILIAFA